MTGNAPVQQPGAPKWSHDVRAVLGRCRLAARAALNAIRTAGDVPMAELDPSALGRMQHAACVVSGAGVVMDANAKFVAEVAASRAAVIGAPLLDLFVGDATEECERLLAVARRQGCSEGQLSLRRSGADETPIRTKLHRRASDADGVVRLVMPQDGERVSAQPVAAPAGLDARALRTREEIERALNVTQERYARVIDGADEAFWEFDVPRKIVTDSARFSRMLGYEPGERESSFQTWFDAIHPEDRERVIALAREHLADRTAKLTCEYRVRTKRGDYIWILTRGRIVVRDDHGAPLIVSGTHADITARKVAALEVAASEHRLRMMLEALPIGVAMLDGDGRVVACNEASDRLLGVSRQQHLAPDFDDVRLPLFRSDGGPMPLDCYPTRRVARERHAVRDVLVEVRRPTGSTWISVSAMPLEVPPNGQLVSYVDVSDRQEVDRRLRLALSVFTNTHEGILVTDSDARIIDANESFLRSTGYTWDEVRGRNPSMFSSGLQSEKFYADMWRELHATGYWRGQLWNRGRSGDFYATMATLSLVRDDSGQVRNYVGLFTDITSILKHEQVLEGIAYHDTLTGLPNRLLFEDRLALALAHARRQERCLVVAFIDLDGFKQINDQYGHSVGDRFLASIGRELGMSLRAGDTLARFGGDEFTALLVDLDDVRESLPVLERLQHSAARSVQVGDLTLQLTASIGVAAFPAAAASAEELIVEADRAMYVAKRAGKNRIFGRALGLEMPAAQPLTRPAASPTERVTDPKDSGEGPAAGADCRDRI